MTDDATPGRAFSGRSVLTLLLSAGFLSALWNLPLELHHFKLAVLTAVSVEVVLLLAALALWPALRQGRLAFALRAVVASATTLWLVVALAELTLRTSLGRPLNLFLDIQLAPSLVDLLTGTLGGALGWLALAGVVGVLAIVFMAAWLAVGATQRALGCDRLRTATLAVSALVVMLLIAQWAAPAVFTPYRPAALHATNTLLAQLRRTRAMLAELETFEHAVVQDPFREVPPENLLRQLSETDVIVMYVESYGRSALERPRFAEVLGPRLDAVAQNLEAAGLSVASGYLTSPTVGGQSWLAHGTLQSGLWLANQEHYDLLVQSERLTLSKAFARAGHRTIAVKPAIIHAWPEGERFGYARIYAAADLGYRGRPYNWVTMPDQYTLWVMQRRERETERQQPLYAEVSLISSHAPWTPIPPVLDDWRTIGDGTVFSRWADDGDPPEVVWRDPERVRRQYALALDYVLGVLGSYAARFVDQGTLLILVGDHQSSPLITGEGAGRDVPMHVISGDPRLIAPFLDWGYMPGMHPDPAAPVHRMDAFRDWFFATFRQPG